MSFPITRATYFLGEKLPVSKDKDPETQATKGKATAKAKPNLAASAAASSAESVMIALLRKKANATDEKEIFKIIQNKKFYFSS